MIARGSVSLVALALAFASSGCKGKEQTEIPSVEVPVRSPTAGDALLEMAPAGADAVLEIDLLRLRKNDTVGPLVNALAQEDMGGFDVFRDADQIVICSYAIGTDDAAQILMLRGASVSSIDGAHAIADDVVVVTTAAMLEKIRAVRNGAASVASQEKLMRARAMAMPPAADGATLRVAATLGFDARVAVAKQLRVDAVPISISVWGDVADDMAIVALLGGEDRKEGKSLASAARRARDRYSATPTARRLLYGYVLRLAKVESQGSLAKVTLIIGPKRLSNLVRRLMKRIGVVQSEKAS